MPARLLSILHGHTLLACLSSTEPALLSALVDLLAVGSHSVCSLSKDLLPVDLLYWQSLL